MSTENEILEVLLDIRTLLEKHTASLKEPRRDNTLVTFLNLDEVAELTGIRMGRNGKTGNQRQVEQLRGMGIPFWVNASGRPVIARAAIEGRQQAKTPERKKWQMPAMEGE